MEEHSYDIIIIGSGIGGLCAGSLLAQTEKKRVLILERHFQVGGFTHSFRRKRKYEWDVGVHYIGAVDEGEQLRRVYDKITGGKLKWHRMPDPYDVFDYPDFSFGVPETEERFRAALIDRFPEESDAIHQYFRDLKRGLKWYQKNETIKSLPPVIKQIASLFHRDHKFALQTVESYLKHRFKDEKLQAVVSSQWGDYGLPPHYATFALHCILVLHYINGAFYPVGGAKKIAEYTLPMIEQAGGKAIANAQVEEILIENGKAVGVRVNHVRQKEEKKYYAPVIISNAGAYITYTRLLPANTHPWQKRIQEFVEKNPVSAHISVYLGLKDSPESLGIHGENHWIFQGYDHNKAYEGLRHWTGDSYPGVVYASFPSLKDPEAEAHTAELITFADYSLFEKWKDLPWKKRGEEYEKLKKKIADQMLKVMEEKFPGFGKLIDYLEVSSPLTTVSMTDHYKGTIYGLSSVPDRYDTKKSPWCQARTPIKNLYLTGTDVTGLGVSGALMGGVVTAIQLVKPHHIPGLLKLT